MKSLKLTSLSPMLLVCATVLAQDSQVPTAYDVETVAGDLVTALENRVDVARNTVGIVVGILTEDGRHYLSHGMTDRQGGSEPDPDTVFEIGSITKVFTTLLLAQVVERGEMSLDDPLSMYLPDSVSEPPSHNGIVPTLADLAIHTSGLPGAPTNLAPADPRNRYADYTPEQLYEFLSGYQLPRDPGSRWAYSNVGVALLGHILELHAGVPYEELLQSSILEPLGMNSTTITLTEEHSARMATGYDGFMREAPMLDWQVLKGQGAIKSTAEDMLTFAEAWLDEDVFGPEKALMLSVVLGADSDYQQYVGWKGYGMAVLFHDGVTNGYRSILAVHPEGRRAAVVLANSTQVDVNQLALHAVMPQDFPLTVFAAPQERTEIELAPAILERYVGTYASSPTDTVEMLLEDGRLFWQVGAVPNELAAESETVFFDRSNPSRLTIEFLTDSSGVVTALRFDYDGTVGTARRVVVSSEVEVAE